MEFALAATSLAASVLTFFSGFGLGTVLMPVMLIWFPAPVAIALTGVVHFANSLFKLSLTHKQVNGRVFLRFGLPAIVAAWLGSKVLVMMGDLPVWQSYSILGIQAETGPMKLLVALLLLCFVFLEYAPSIRRISIHERFLPLGGCLSGFFGGLTGNQGALRSAFLVRSGMTKEQFVGTSAMLSACVDMTRLGNYAGGMQTYFSQEMITPVATPVIAAMTGAWFGNRMLKKTTMESVHKTVATCLFLLAILLGFGIL